MFKYNVYVYVFLMRFNLIKNYEKNQENGRIFIQRDQFFFQDLHYFI